MTPDNDERRNRKIIDMWMASYTNEEIAEAVGCNRATVTTQIAEFRKTVLQNQIPKAAADHVTDFTPPLYNVWRKNET